MISQSGKGRIRGAPVPPLFPSAGPIHVLVMGEAPGPRGADQSGIPFWGDRSGRQVYRALCAAQMADVPEQAWTAWDGARLRALGLAPVLRGAALTNALAHCPSNDGRAFRAPRQAELCCEGNLTRVASDLARAAARSPAPLVVIALGRHAHALVERIRRQKNRVLELHGLPHPSAQGLLGAAPERGRGCKLAELQAAWEAKLVDLLRAARPDARVLYE